MSTDPMAKTTDALSLAGLDAAERDTIGTLIRMGIGENTLRAIRSDLRYIEEWSQGAELHEAKFPPSAETLIRFIGHHLWSEDERARDARHGMPDGVRDHLLASGVLRTEGPHSVATVRRRLSTWRQISKMRSGDDDVFANPMVVRITRLAIKAVGKPAQKKSERAVSSDLVQKLFAHLFVEAGHVDDTRRHLTALRDMAMIAVAFGSGGRRRSEIARMRVSDVEPMPPIEREGKEPVPSVSIYLGRTKTTSMNDNAQVFLNGAPVLMLDLWKRAAKITNGALFRSIDRWGNVSDRRPTDETLNVVIKQRLAEIGEDPELYSAHGLRAGYITEAFKAGVSTPEIMQMTLHRSERITTAYFNDEKKRLGRAAMMLMDDLFTPPAPLPD